MRNPFRTETEAFRFVIATLIYFVLIAVGAVVNVWLGLAVFIVLGAAGVYFLLLLDRNPERPLPTAPTDHHAHAGERRILVLANETVLGRELRECIKSKSEGYDEKVYVVAPALNSPLKHWVSDEDGARLTAQERLESSLAALRSAGIDADGEIGDGDPLQAVEDALRTFGPDEVIISTHPEGRSHWLERGIIDAARERITVPVTHVVVDLERQQEEVR
jgi:GABA permease